jgi:hypothetical protein
MRDIDIRAALRVEMEAVHEGDPDTLILEEMGLCQGIARVDVAVVNGSLHGYEIKSDRDTLARLPAQAEIYNRVFDFVTIVTGRNHERKVADSVPQWWGISIAVPNRTGLKLHTRRRARRNKQLNPLSLVQLLWREETLLALAQLGLAEGLKSKKRDILWTRLVESVDLTTLSSIVREAIKRRVASVEGSSPQQLCGG